MTLLGSALSAVTAELPAESNRTRANTEEPTFGGSKTRKTGIKYWLRCPVVASVHRIIVFVGAVSKYVNEGRWRWIPGVGCCFRAHTGKNQGEKRCEGGGFGCRSSFIKSLREVAPVVFQPVHQWRMVGRGGGGFPEEDQHSIVLSPSCLLLPSRPPSHPHAPLLTAHLLTAITPPSSSPPSH